MITKAGDVFPPVQPVATTPMPDGASGLPSHPTRRFTRPVVRSDMARMDPKTGALT
ncbi:MAG: hypothetical protein H7Y08_05745 [Rhizobiaceae bacterium]|nr:hypothetical protein [Rhizobiaceae bacterium]